MSIIPSFFRGSNVFDPFSLDAWDPQDVFLTRVDWKETPEAYVFKADLPGLKKEDVKVEMEDDRVLQISGERSRENDDKNDKWHRVERSSGKFLRRLWLPENAKVDDVKAGMENGVLTVIVPKHEVKKPEVKAHYKKKALPGRHLGTIFRPRKSSRTTHRPECVVPKGSSRNVFPDGIFFPRRKVGPTLTFNACLRGRFFRTTLGDDISSQKK
ncbi:17.5 kDa class I heat shock protein-like [Rutidosis leptorrhynchoides]|uniref:17.5 kDa class I heat shock protein-like n=1 Tax=Rutidosis leptorrhynchoides TaxID=125765 RepID=UPI003A997965